MAKTQITCVNKTPRDDAHDRIDNVGGSGWVLPEDEVIAQIENGQESYFVSVDGASVDVIVEKHQGHKYLKTERDGLQPNNLLSLPECSSD
jgi:hypothetical protein